MKDRLVIWMARIFKADALASLVNWLSVPLLFLYLVSMVVFPWYKSNLNWDAVQIVWDRWQTLNAAVIAFIASVVALNISRYHESKQRERRIAAANALLPHALSELISYYIECARYLKSSWGYLRAADAQYEPKREFNAVLPKKPYSYAEILGRCIEHADFDVGDYMARTVMRLQIHESRMMALHNSLTKVNRVVLLSTNILDLFHGSAKLYATTSRLMKFARRLEKLNNSVFTAKEYGDAYFGLDIQPENFAGLEEVTKSRLADSVWSDFEKQS